MMVYVTVLILDNGWANLNAGVIIFYLSFALIWSWLIFGELRSKAIVVEIGYDGLKFSGYLGLVNYQYLSFNEIDGFETTTLPSRYGEYEYLYLIKGKKRRIIISQFYHENYSELKKEITNRCLFLGHKQFSYMSELKRIFSVP